MNKPTEFTLKMHADAIQVILDVFDQTPMPQRVSRPITDMIVKQVSEQANPPIKPEPAAPADTDPAADAKPAA